MASPAAALYQRARVAQVPSPCTGVDRPGAFSPAAPPDISAFYRRQFYQIPRPDTGNRRRPRAHNLSGRARARVNNRDFVSSRRCWGFLRVTPRLSGMLSADFCRPSAERIVPRAFRSAATFCLIVPRDYCGPRGLRNGRGAAIVNIRRKSALLTRTDIRAASAE